MKKETLKDNLRTAIAQLGGIKAVADRFEIPYRTVQNWSDGVRTPPTYVAKMIFEVEKQDRRDNESYKDYVEDQEALGWYESELEKEQQKNEVLQKQFDAMVELAKNRREEIKACEEVIDQLQRNLDNRAKAELEMKMEIESCYSNINELAEAYKAIKKELAKEKRAREVWARQAGTLTRK